MATNKQITSLSTLQIHKLSQAQYNEYVKSEDFDDYAIYLTPDEDDYITQEDFESAVEEVHKTIDEINTTIKDNVSKEYIEKNYYDKATIDDGFLEKANNSAVENIVKTVDAAQGAADAAQGTADEAVAAVEELAKYVGTIPATEAYEDIEDVIGYVDKKAEETLASAQGSSSQTAAEVSLALDNYKAENDAKVNESIDAFDALQTGLNAEIARIDAIIGDYLQEEDKKDLQGNIDDISDIIKELIGDNTSQSLDDMIVNKLTNLLVDKDAEEAFDTLEEMAAWIKDHPDDVAQINSSIQNLKKKLTLGTYKDNNDTDVEYDTVKNYIESVLSTIQTRIDTKVGSADYNLKIAAIDGSIQSVNDRFNNLTTSNIGMSNMPWEGQGLGQDLDEALLNIESALINQTQVNSDINDAIDGFEDTYIKQDNIKDISENNLTDALKKNYDDAYDHSLLRHAPEDAEKNKIESIKINGDPLTPKDDRSVEILIPVSLSELDNDTGFVTSNDIAGKANTSEVYTKYEADGIFAKLEDLKHDHDEVYLKPTDIEDLINKVNSKASVQVIVWGADEGADV